MSKHLLLFDFRRLYHALDYLSARDAAALRCLKRKYEELQDDIRIPYDRALVLLTQEYHDCLPVDA